MVRMIRSGDCRIYTESEIYETRKENLNEQDPNDSARREGLARGIEQA